MEPLWTTNTFEMLGALMGVLALIFAAAWLMRRVQHTQGTGKQHLRIVSVLPLSTKERMLLVQAGEEQVLIGVSTAGIAHLHTLTQPILADAATDKEPPTTLANFAESLRSVMSRTRS